MYLLSFYMPSFIFLFTVLWFTLCFTLRLLLQSSILLAHHSYIHYYLKILSSLQLQTFKYYFIYSGSLLFMQASTTYNNYLLFIFTHICLVFCFYRPIIHPFYIYYHLIFPLNFLSSLQLQTKHSPTFIYPSCFLSGYLLLIFIYFNFFQYLFSTRSFHEVLTYLLYLHTSLYYSTTSFQFCFIFRKPLFS